MYLPKYHALLRRSATATIVIFSCAANISLVCAATGSASCINQSHTFDGSKQLTYTTIKANTGEHVSLYREFPVSCPDPKTTDCQSHSYLLAGDHVAVAANCGGYSDVQYIGPSHISTGWVRTQQLELSTDQESPARSNGSYYFFSLVKGKGTPVCEAYLQRLNQTDFQAEDKFRPPNSPPFCGRPENDAVPGFAKLERRMLTAQAIYKLSMPVWNLRSGEAARPNYEIWSYQNIQAMLSRALFVWDYPQGIDIENNGSKVNIMLWQGMGLSGGTEACGLPYTTIQPDSSLRQYTIAYVMSADGGTIDEGETRAVFGHPVQAYTVRDRDGKNDVVKRGFRPIGTSIGIFEYRSAYYFDTFFDVWGDFYNQRRDEPALANRLGVFLRKEGKTAEVCELKLSGNDYPKYPTWSLNP